MTLRGLPLLGLLLAISSCKELDRFDTRGDAAYCGDLVSGPPFHDGFVATGEPPALRMKLTLDTSQLGSLSESKTALPGTLTSNDAARGICADQPLFQRAFLRAIPQVSHDAISTLSFGEGHEHDFFAWTDSTCQGTMLAVVSLLSSGDVELRLFKPARMPTSGEGPEKRPGFALFSLSRRDKGCEF